MPTVTGYALAHLRKRAAELGPDASRELPFTRVALRDFVRELGDPATLGEALAEVDAAYRQVVAEIDPQRHALEEVAP